LWLARSTWFKLIYDAADMVMLSTGLTSYDGEIMEWNGLDWHGMGNLGVWMCLPGGPHDQGVRDELTIKLVELAFLALIS
jgi:hypothetical protein